jgi:hypothetical protein
MYPFKYQFENMREVFKHENGYLYAKVDQVYFSILNFKIKRTRLVRIRKDDNTAYYYDTKRTATVPTEAVIFMFRQYEYSSKVLGS